MSKLQIPMIHDSYAMNNVASHVNDRMRYHLGLGDPDDEMREDVDGLDCDFVFFTNTTNFHLKIQPFKADGSVARFTHSQYVEIIEALGHTQTELPDGLEFFEIYTATENFLVISFIIDKNEPLRNWHTENFVS